MNQPSENAQINETVLGALKRPPPALFYLILLLLAAGFGAAVVSWIVQVKVGMVIAGINHPVGWGVYIGNLVFWVAVAMSGSFVSATLYLMRAKLRSTVSRAAETMTLFAVMMAGLFPLVHLGRLWVFYYILPYPSERQIWPNFQSALFWDVLAILTYLIVSTIFYFVGLIPDLAAARDYFSKSNGKWDFRPRLYRELSLGFSFAASQWRHYSRAYLFFAALVTPLAISIHSVTSWDFAMSLLPGPGWHETIYAPYFVCGAVLSGSAMALTILIPLRRMFHLESLITPKEINGLSKLVVIAALLVGYIYCVELFIAWYSGDKFARQFALFYIGGWISPLYWLQWVFNVFTPLLLLFKAVRKRPGWVVVICLVINLGMWIERLVLTAGSTSQDFLPHNWGPYIPRWPEGVITAGSFCFFVLGVIAFAKIVPMIALADTKEEHTRMSEPLPEIPAGRVRRVPAGAAGVKAVFAKPETLLWAAAQVKKAGFKHMEIFSPFPLREALKIASYGPDPVRLWTLAGVVFGAGGGILLALWAEQRNALIVGGIPPLSFTGFWPVVFELGVLFGAIFNLIGLIVHARLYSLTLPRWYDPRFSDDRFGLIVGCRENEIGLLRSIVAAHTEEIHGLS